MLDAAVKLLKRGGAASITTNSIAAAAGVSIGSVYQYFPNKHALFAALHERHIRDVDEVLERKMQACGGGSLEDLVKAWMDGMAEAHARDPELSELLKAEVPHRADGTVEFSIRLHRRFREALAECWGGTKTDLDTPAFVAVNMVEALGHATVFRRPRGLSLARAKTESCRAILAYLAG
jgi:AcrR family transcriptional regulator